MITCMLNCVIRMFILFQRKYILAISNNIFDRAIKQTLCAFNAKSNQIISDFSMSNYFSLHKLNTTYCMNLYSGGKKNPDLLLFYQKKNKPE